MKWIENLPDDFTQDFLFRFQGVQNESDWITRNLEIGRKDWSKPVTLLKDEILRADGGLFCSTLRKEDFGSKPIEYVFKKNMQLRDFDVSLYAEISAEIVRVSFYEKDVYSLSGIDAFPHIRCLTINSCEEFHDLTGLGSLNQLVHLRINYCPGVTEFSEIEELTNLEYISFEGCDGLVGLPMMARCAVVARLDLNYCSELRCLEGLSELESLESVNLAWCTALKSTTGIEGCTNIRRIDLAGCSILKDISSLGNLRRLELINLSQCEDLIEVHALSELIGLISLDLSDCWSLLDISALSGLKGLTNLFLGGCEVLHDISALASLSSLNYLDLSRCVALEDISALSGLRGLLHLDLSGCKALQDISALTGLFNLETLFLRKCEAINDVSVLSELKGLTSIDLSDCPYVDHANNCEAISTLDALKELKGIGEPSRTQILWNAARRRESKDDLAELLEKMLELCNSPMSISTLRADFIEGLAFVQCSDERLSEIHELQWSREEWARLLVVTDNRLDPVGRAPLLGIDVYSREIVSETHYTFFREDWRGRSGAVTLMNSWVGIRDAMKGYIYNVAQGVRWPGSQDIILLAFAQALKEFSREGVDQHPSWEEAIVDLLMALRGLGLEKEHNSLLNAATAENRQAFDQRLRVEAAEAALNRGRWSEALQYMRNIPSDIERHLMNRVIPMVMGEELPETILRWIEKDWEYELKQFVQGTGLSPSEGLQNRHIREQFFFIQASTSQSFLELIGSIFETFPDDPWVLALGAECNLNNGGSQSRGLLESMQSESLRNLLGPMVSQELKVAIESQTEAELHNLAVALLLEHYGVVNPQFRETLLSALQSQNSAS